MLDIPPPPRDSVELSPEPNSERKCDHCEERPPAEFDHQIHSMLYHGVPPTDETGETVSAELKLDEKGQYVVELPTPP
jgi:hypothetical protein